MTNPDLVYTTYIKTTPEKLWAAITNPEFTRQYWGGHANISDWKKGSKWQHEDAGNNNTVHISGKVLENTPSKRLVLSWASPGDEADVSTVTFEIEPIENLVRLNVIHGSFKQGSTSLYSCLLTYACLKSSAYSPMPASATAQRASLFLGAITRP